MYLTAPESRALSCIFGLLAEDMAEHEVRERVGYGLLDLLKAGGIFPLLEKEGAIAPAGKKA